MTCPGKKSTLTQKHKNNIIIIYLKTLILSSIISQVFRHLFEGREMVNFSPVFWDLLVVQEDSNTIAHGSGIISPSFFNTLEQCLTLRCYRLSGDIDMTTIFYWSIWIPFLLCADLNYMIKFNICKENNANSS